MGFMGRDVRNLPKNIQNNFSLCTSTLTSISPGVCIREIFVPCCIVLNFLSFSLCKKTYFIFLWLDQSPTVCFQRALGAIRNVSLFVFGLTQ